MRPILRRYRRIILPLSALALIALGWQVIVRLFAIPAIILPSPWEVLGTALDERATLWSDTLATLREILMAASLAIGAGLASGIAINLFPLFRRAVYPYMLVTQIVPKVALAPVLVVWVGVGAPSRLMLAVLIAYFPMVINTTTGFVTVNKSMVLYVQSLVASKWQVLIKVGLPHALPAIVNGAKITVSVSVIGIIVGEFVASDRGLGRRVMDASAVLNTPLALAAVVAIGILGLCLMGLVESLEKRIVYWRSVE